MDRIAILAITIFLSVGSVATADDDEISLFNSKGKAIAYIVMDDEMTIYMWSGAPAAYLKTDTGAKGFHIYGFNGKHLGWSVDGVARNHDGDAACAVKERMQSAEREPYKAYKQYKPYKSYTEYAPYRPAFSKIFGDVTCSAFLMEGAK
jgi:hypothetical protein